VRVRGGNIKRRALRLDTGNFAWGSEACTRKTRILDVVYNASNNELVRTKTLVKSAVVQVDATPFRQWWEQHYGEVLGKRKAALKAAQAGQAAPDVAPQASIEKRSKNRQRKLDSRKDMASVDPLLDDLFAIGRLYAIISSRPGQSGRADGYILEGKELEFYTKKIKAKK
jgi:small subunit ribosomal protein S8e